MKPCPNHGMDFVQKNSQGRRVCRRCEVERVTQRRRDIKAILVKEHGGKCVRCGYDRCARSLTFHHLDPAAKQFAIAANVAIIGLDGLKKEVKKCALVCANCHGEIEAGLADVSPLSDKELKE